MKFRQGFVSNSSTSSFVLVGADISHLTQAKTDREFWDFVGDLKDDHEDIDIYAGTEDGLKKRQIVAGISVRFNEDDATEIVDIDDFLKKVRAIELTKDLPIKMYVGTEMS